MDDVMMRVQTLKKALKGMLEIASNIVFPRPFKNISMA